LLAFRTWGIRLASPEKDGHLNVSVRGPWLEDGAGEEVVAECDPGGVRLYDVQLAGIDHLEPLRMAVWTLEVVEVAHSRERRESDRLVVWCGLDSSRTVRRMPSLLMMNLKRSVE